MKDMVQKDRNPKVINRVNGPILNRDLVYQILDRIVCGQIITTKQIISEYSVSESTVLGILNGKRWNKVTKEYLISLQDIRDIIIKDKRHVRRKLYEY